MDSTDKGGQQVMVWRTERRVGPELQMDDEFVWMTQAAMEAWTGRADLKASVLLALQGAAFVVLLTGYGIWQPSCSPLLAQVGVTAMVLLVTAMTLAGLVIIPALGSVRQHKIQHPQHMFFFGHVRLWQPDALAERLSQLTTGEKEIMMAYQLVSVSRINWRKYRLLQASVVLTILVVAIVAFLFAAGIMGLGCHP